MENLAFIIRVLLFKGILGPFVKIVLGVKFRYDERPCFDQPKIIVANHNSHVDAIAILCSLSIKDLKRVHPVVARDYFYRNSFTKLFAKLCLNSVSVSRSRQFENPLKQCESLLESGHSLIIFPEGTRGNANEMKDFKQGVSILLKKFPNVEFVPAFCEGFGEILPKGQWLVLPSNSFLKIGKSKKVDRSREVSDITNYIRKSILELRY
ncbi:putative acyltransferase [Halobacteriovorax marinus SJ]|uniref:Acyltransferase n=1 Tax=Halobacteriovorax marinus (strain ATCC BAA-682 / DSM 15412 / SJ) TaxID=862908 RepID=E1X4G2_HALMS|nr:lysophospholipid acyltransferase family protein [Halobacteriovorax marinus]CBW25392.1 putative acyltransferase [Halobacteriovorax marinus SJ]